MNRLIKMGMILTTVVSFIACMLFSSSPLTFEPDSLPTAQIGGTYEVEIHLTQNRTSVGDFFISKGALPAGLDLKKVKGVDDTAKIIGTPQATGTFTFTIGVWC